MKLRQVISIFISKFAIKVLRLIKKGGTTLPGKLAFKIYPGILRSIAGNFEIIMVTGTNGKTTTTRIIEEILKNNNIDYITNKSGANLLSGITTIFIQAVTLTGKPRHRVALIESDEAAFNQVTKHLQPKAVVVTNFFRDQLDRYGELYSTLNAVKSGLERVGDNTSLILNADDSMCASLGRETNKPVFYYGIAPEAGAGDTGNSGDINTDAMFCINCKNKYEYTNHIYGHLGGFYCTGCGYKRPAASLECTGIQETGSSHTTINWKSAPPLSETLQEYTTRINLPGLYNVYNAMAAATCGLALNYSANTVISAMQSFECGFGRMESITVGDKTIKLILVKNPTGFNQVLSFLALDEQQLNAAFLINDKLADGTDISWLWDVDFEQLNKNPDKIGNLFASGLRGEDMAVRLKYSGLDTRKIRIIKDYQLLLERGLEQTPPGGCFHILPTYTAMLDIRGILKKKYNLKEFWK
ncbi:MurT ligase domain-containing protein [Ruminiclostridium cellobioparum]|uniref:Lipid II isoglutaminyl synthase (glutamine-hydrolyzing) subunit MurT n=1 Tax=Ruminiclostridium cellobioparum subsp. termitidis CT1112 TaxID=1195236 RepID=S0FI00_RUMCE|nr:MurT ligase domain-containing protein [Ruminiclostridium cellobioparum]EMS71192.1 UDP-N-acetylmuramyl tripeptide synthase [Ruminiclostridium cellobioparum subsp. termitidis CT1112]